MKFDYQMGFDGTKPGHQLVSTSNIKRYTSTTANTGELAKDNSNNNITPFTTL